MNKQGANDAIQAEIFNEYLLLKGLSEQTRATTLRTVYPFAVWADAENIPLQNIGYNDVVAYMDYCRKKGNKQRTLQVIINCIKHYYGFLLSRDEVADNPCTNVDIKGVKRKMLYDTFTPEELENIYQTYCSRRAGAGGKAARRRNKIILGLIVYQALRTEELGRLTVTDVKPREGKIYIAGTRRTNERTLTLEAHQVYDLMDYINETRKLIVSFTEKKTDALFTSLGESERFNNITTKLFKELKKQNRKIKDNQHLRASVIANWLKVYDIRKVQYLAGHRYVSSTEAYQANNLEDLKEDVNRYHPNF